VARRLEMKLGWIRLLAGDPKPSTDDAGCAGMSTWSLMVVSVFQDGFDGLHRAPPACA